MIELLLQWDLSWKYHVGYPRSGFEYFLNEFAPEGDQVRPRVDHDRTPRALSIAHLIF